MSSWWFHLAGPQKLILSEVPAPCRFITHRPRTVKQNLQRFRADLSNIFGPEIAGGAERVTVLKCELGDVIDGCCEKSPDYRRRQLQNSLMMSKPVSPEDPLVSRQTNGRLVTQNRESTEGRY
jgi:hypothetical protein